MIQDKYNLITLIEQAKPSIAPSTKKSYYYGIKRAATKGIQQRLGMGQSTNPVSLKWISSHAAVIKRVAKESDTVQKTTMTALMVISRHLFGEESKSYLAYQKRSDTLNGLIQVEQDKHIKTPSQEKNWTTIDALREHVVTLPVESQLDRDRRLVGSLYVYQPPARNDYGQMELIDEEAEKQPDVNYLVLRDGKPLNFYFQVFKTHARYGNVTVPVTAEMSKELTTYLDGRTTGFMFDKKLTKTQVGYALAAAFKGTGKHITINLIRHIVASEMINVEKRVAEQVLASAMMHGSATQVTYAKA